MELSKGELKKIVFICVENARRSQMAEGFAKKLGYRKVEVYSAGSRPSSAIDMLVIDVMKEKGVDLSHKRPKRASWAFTRNPMFPFPYPKLALKEREVVNEKIAITVDVVMFDHSL